MKWENEDVPKLNHADAVLELLSSNLNVLGLNLQQMNLFQN